MEVCYLWLEVSVLKPNEVTRLFIDSVACVLCVGVCVCVGFDFRQRRASLGVKVKTENCVWRK